MAGILDTLATIFGQSPTQTTQMSGGIPIPQPRPMEGSVPEDLQRIFGMPKDEFKNRIRAIAAGMSVTPTDGESSLSHAMRSFGATQKYFTDQDEASAALKREQEKLAYDRAIAERKLDVDERRWQAGHAIDQSAEDRQRAAAELNAEKTRSEIEKTRAEIERLAKTGGVTVAQQLEIERISQAAAENERDPEKRKAIIDAERKRLQEYVKSGNPNPISDGDGLSSDTPISGGQRTATGPNGEKLILRNGTWEPLTR